MKVPRDLSGKDLAAALNKVGYQVTRQKSSHIRLTTERNGQHHILKEIAGHLGISRDELLVELFG
jgi:predicted RNA binding protein YcfA (HicA-like mRNA interferase family)